MREYKDFTITEAPKYLVYNQYNEVVATAATIEKAKMLIDSIIDEAQAEREEMLSFSYKDLK